MSSARRHHGFWLVVSSSRCTGVWRATWRLGVFRCRVAKLTEEEAAELGPLLRRTAAAVDRLLKPEQVWAWLFSHAGGRPAHIHYVVQPGDY